MNVYEMVPYAQAVETGGKKPIGMKWVDVFRNSGKHGKHQNRLVAKDFNSRWRESSYC